MNTNKSLTKTAKAAIILALTIVSCTHDSEVDELTTVELRLSSGVSVSTKASFPDADTQIPNGEQIVVYVDETGGAVQLYENNSLTADGAGNLSGGTRMYFPANGNNIDIYALHSNAALTAAYPTTALTHTVSGDQRTLAGYAPSDMLYAKRTNVASTASPVLMTFYHLLSKIQVAIMPGEGLAPADIAGISIGGTRLQAQFTLAKAANPDAVAITAAGTAAPITIGADVSPNLTTNIQFNDAIIVPQTLASGTALISIRLSDNTNLTYRLPENTTFESGKKYGYLITTNTNTSGDLTELILETTIEDWLPTDYITGEATLE